MEDYEDPLRGNGRENGFWNKRKGSVIFLFSFNAWKIAHCAFNSWIRKFDPIFGRLLSSPSAVRIYPTRLRDWKLFQGKHGKHVAKWRADRGTNDPLQSNAQLPANP